MPQLTKQKHDEYQSFFLILAMGVAILNLFLLDLLFLLCGEDWVPRLGLPERVFLAELSVCFFEKEVRTSERGMLGMLFLGIRLFKLFLKLIDLNFWEPSLQSPFRWSVEVLKASRPYSSSSPHKSSKFPLFPLICKGSWDCRVGISLSLLLGFGAIGWQEDFSWSSSLTSSSWDASPEHSGAELEESSSEQLRLELTSLSCTPLEAPPWLEKSSVSPSCPVSSVGQVLISDSQTLLGVVHLLLLRAGFTGLGSTEWGTWSDSETESWSLRWSSKLACWISGLEILFLTSFSWEVRERLSWEPSSWRSGMGIKATECFIDFLAAFSPDLMGRKQGNN